MNTDFIAANLISKSVYVRKEGTNSSYYRNDGNTLLPHRLSITRGDVTPVKKQGRNRTPSVGQMIGTYKQWESSPLKQYKPYNLRSQIWQNINFPQFIGWGSIGISGADGKITSKDDTGDLLILYSDDVDWLTIRIYVFSGLAKETNPTILNQVFTYVANIV